jgi:hypothetical protein
MSTNVYDDLIADALAEVERGERHACRTTDECRLMLGCVKCSGVLRGEIGIEHVEIFPGDDGVGILRITTSEHHNGSPCVVSVRVPMMIHA